MNTRDPFNIRRQVPPSPLTYVQSANYFSRRHSNQTDSQPQLRQTSASRSQSAEPDNDNSNPAAGGASLLTVADMSSSAQPVPSGNDSRLPSMHPRRATNPPLPTNGAGVGEKIGSMLSPAKENEELPMYKDKPYNYAPSQRRPPMYRRWRMPLIILALLMVLLYLSGAHSKISKHSSIQKTPEDKPKSSFSVFSGRKKSAANWEERRERVRDAFKVSWAAYEKSAWGFDEFHPASQTSRQMVEPNGVGWIIVDSLDTMMLMNLTTQLNHAREWISTTLSYDLNHDVNTFETTIRMLGGLLSAHYLSENFPNMAPVPKVKGSQGEDLYLEKATDLADRLMGAYESPSGIPYASVNLHKRKGIPSHADAGASSTAEAASLQLEMKYLAKLTGEKNYWDASEKIIKVIDDNGMKDGLLPIFISAQDGKFAGNNIRLGSRGDSYYEYLIKQYLQTSSREPVYLELWNQALNGIQKHLITYTKYANLTVLGERPGGLDEPVFPKMDHLVCFMPGTIALAVTGGKTVAQAKESGAWGDKQEREMELAKELMKTCWGMYQVTASGLAPEIGHFRIHDPPLMMSDGIPNTIKELTQNSHIQWRMDFDIHNADFHNVQRPEFVESLFYMWRITGDQAYRDWGWEVFESFEKHTILPDGKGYSSVNNVDRIPPPTRDNMESFWLSETLKYFYLLFGPDDILPLDEVVINTEAHPFPIFEPGKLFSTGWKRKPRDREGNIMDEKAAATGETNAVASSKGS